MQKRPKRRKLNLTHIRKGLTYTVEDVVSLFGVHSNTVRTWINGGLKALDEQRPLLIHGSELHEYLHKKQVARKQTCQDNELYCFKCRAPKRPYGGMIDVAIINQKTANISGLCEFCNTALNRRASLQKLAEILNSHEQVRLLNPHLIESLPASLNCYFKKVPK